MLAGLSACDRPHCEELSRVEVEGAEITPAGSVGALLEQVDVDGEHAAAWWDGQAVLARLRISAGEQSPLWIETQERENRLLEPWSNDLQVFCPDYLHVPVDMQVAAGEDVDLELSGQAVRWEGEEDALYRVSGTLAYQDGLLPETDRDPSLYSDKAITLSVSVLDAQIWRGRLAWTGQRELEGATQYMSETVLEFEEVME